MNKTVTVNIGGMVFHIEEHAYDKLKKYLDANRGYFTSSDGRDEIIQDIESRIAEMFTERIGSSRQVIVEDDVEAVINTMGRPEEVAGDNAEGKNAESFSSYSNTTNSKGYRRLFRDPDDKVIGGVCSGIAHYLGCDPVWIRLGFAIALFVFGTGFLLYLLLLIIIPKAETTADKLEMKGQPVNIDNIKRTIKDEYEDMKSKFNSGGFRDATRRSGSAVSRFFEMLGQIIVGAFKVAFKVIAFLLMITLIIMLIALFVITLNVAGITNWGTMPSNISHMFFNTSQQWLVITTAILFLGVPLITVLYRIVRLFVNAKTENKYLNTSAGVLWGVGWVLLFISIAVISKDYKVKESRRNEIPIVQPVGNTMYLQLLHPHTNRDEHYYDNDWNINADTDFSWYDENDTIRINNVKLDVVRADGDKFELVKIISSRGSNRRNAQDNARGISYEIVQTDSILKIDENFLLPPKSKFRDQKIQLLLKVPVGKRIHLAEESDRVFYDIKNVTDTYDSDMVGYTWTMTDKGLECIGCNLQDNNGKNRNEHVKIHVNGKDVSIDANNDTINWDDKDVKIHIDENGVVIDAKEKKK